MECWAKGLGNCEGEISKEHLVSAGVLGDKTVLVRGLSWCLKDYKEIGINSIVSNILCRKHNSDLSVVDQGGIDVLRTIEKIMEIAKERGALPKNKANRLPIKAREIDGKLLERWLLKTTINMMQSQEQADNWDSDCLGNESPPLHLVKSAFGMEPLNKPMGLYCPVKIVTQMTATGHIIGMQFLKKDDSTVVAVDYKFAGVPLFLLWLTAEPLKKKIGWAGKVFPSANLKYRPDRIPFMLHNKKSQILKISWN
jgi:hypothetical protein